jgi:hypothetical protein
VARSRLVISELDFFALQDCNAFSMRITNVGDAEEPFGWDLRVEIPRTGQSVDWIGQQAIPAGGSGLYVGSGPIVTEPGRYLVVVSAVDTVGHAKADRAFMDVPCD